MQANVFFFKWADIACEIPIVVVLLPSPRGVGVMLNMKCIKLTVTGPNSKQYAVLLYMDQAGNGL